MKEPQNFCSYTRELWRKEISLNVCAAVLNSNDYPTCSGPAFYPYHTPLICSMQTSSPLYSRDVNNTNKLSWDKGMRCNLANFSKVKMNWCDSKSISLFPFCSFKAYQNKCIYL